VQVLRVTSSPSHAVGERSQIVDRILICTMHIDQVVPEIEPIHRIGPGFWVGVKKRRFRSRETRCGKSRTIRRAFQDTRRLSPMRLVGGARWARSIAWEESKRRPRI
jgi:hypothetical protein